MITYPLNDIEYNAEDAELYHATRTSGVYANDSFGYSITDAGNTIVIGSGICWIKNGEFSGKVAAQKESVSIDMGVADPTYPRIDAVVIQFDANSNETKIVAKKGTASSSPIPPAVVKTESVYELHIYHIRREAGSSVISNSDVTDLRLDPNYCGIMADSVTQVDTSAISKQINDLIVKLQTEIDSLSNDALNILLKSGPFVLSPYQYGTALPSNPVDGQFFVLIKE